MSVKENVGCALATTAYMILSGLGIIIHVWTIILAFVIKGFWAAVLTFVSPVLSEIFWFFKIGFKVGFTNSWFCIAMMVYAGLWISVFVGAAIAASES